MSEVVTHSDYVWSLTQTMVTHSDYVIVVTHSD